MTLHYRALCYVIWKWYDIALHTHSHPNIHPTMHACAHPTTHSSIHTHHCIPLHTQKPALGKSKRVGWHKFALAYQYTFDVSVWSSASQAPCVLWSCCSSSNSTTMGSLQCLQSWKARTERCKRHARISWTFQDFITKTLFNLWLWSKLETFLCSFPARLQCSLDRLNLEDPVGMFHYFNERLSECLFHNWTVMSNQASCNAIEQF